MGVISLFPIYAPSPVCLSAQAARRSGRIFLVMLITVHWKLNCHDKLVAQREGANNDSSLLIGLCLNQQLERDFLFSSVLIPWSSLPLCTEHWLFFCILETAIFVQSTFLLFFFVLLIVYKSALLKSCYALDVYQQKSRLRVFLKTYMLYI